MRGQNRPQLEFCCIVLWLYTDMSAVLSGPDRVSVRHSAGQPPDPGDPAERRLTPGGHLQQTRRATGTAGPLLADRE